MTEPTGYISGEIGVGRTNQPYDESRGMADDTSIARTFNTEISSTRGARELGARSPEPGARSPAPEARSPEPAARSPGVGLRASDSGARLSEAPSDARRAPACRSTERRPPTPGARSPTPRQRRRRQRRRLGRTSSGCWTQTAQVPCGPVTGRSNRNPGPEPRRRVKGQFSLWKKTQCW